MQTQPIGVACPRCDDDIVCTVEVKLFTGHRTEMRLVDLADRFAEHYVAAGHTASKGVARRALTGPVLEGVQITAGDGLLPPWKNTIRDGIADARPKAPNA